MDNEAGCYIDNNLDPNLQYEDIYNLDPNLQYDMEDNPFIDYDALYSNNDTDPYQQ